MFEMLLFETMLPNDAQYISLTIQYLSPFVGPGGGVSALGYLSKTLIHFVLLKVEGAPYYFTNIGRQYERRPPSSTHI